MTTEFQPVDPRIPYYIPENWIQPTGTGSGGSFINFPTAQTANISFPGSILCSSLQSFAPTAPMNLFNNSTTGSIQIANNSGYTGGIVINADATAPVPNKIIIGDSARALIAPNIETTLLQGYGFSEINVNSDLYVNTGFTTYTDNLDSAIGSILNIGTSNTTTKINIGTSIGHSTNIDIGTNMGVATQINLGGLNATTNIVNLESGLISCAGNAPLSIGTFAGRTRNIDIGTGMSGGNINLGGATTTVRADNIGGATTLTLTTDTTVGNLFVDTLNPNTTPLKLGTTDATIEIGRVASRTTPISIGNLGLGDGTTAGNIFIGSGSNSITSSISLGSSSLNENFVRGKTLRLNDGASAVSTIIGNTFTGNNITISAPTTLNRGFLPAYLPTRYSGDDTYLGGYKEGSYTNFSALSLNTTQQRIVGSISTIMAIGLYQVNINTTLSTSVLNPYLTFKVYTQTAAAWTNGALRGATGSSVSALAISRRSPTTSTSDAFTLSISGLLTVSTSAYVAVVVANGDTSVSQDIVVITDSYISLLRVG